MRDALPLWIQKQLPAETESRYFSSSQGKIHFLARGRGRQVVLIHGNPTWSFLWRNVMCELDPDHFEVIAPDLMNLGFSDDLSAHDFNIETHVTYLNELFRSQVRPGAILAVQDWGGPLGLLAAERCPALFSGYVLLNTGVAAPKFPSRLSWFHKLSRTPVLSEIVFGILGFPMSSLHRVQFDKDSIRGNVARAYRFPISLKRRLSALRFARMVPSSENHPSLAQFQKLEGFCRSLKNVEVVWGVQDPILGRQLKRVKEIIGAAVCTEVQAGHFLQEEEFIEIATAIRRAAASAHQPSSR